MLHSRSRTLAVAAGLFLACSGSALAQSRGPDVIVGTLYTPAVWGSAGGFTAYSVGTFSCNRGDQILSWISGTSAHPVIGQNLFRYTPASTTSGSRFEHIGQSWLKHGFTALQGGECAGDSAFPYAYATPNPNPNGSGLGLGLGASDPYQASLNGSQSSAGPKSDVNATTGAFQYPPTISGGTIPDVTWRRLRVATTDLSTPNALFFYEGQYVAADDCASGNRNNSVSWVNTNLTNNENLPSTDNNRGQAAIQAWPTLDSTVKITPIDVPGDGRFWFAWRVTPIGSPATSWEYEYAIQNLNSDRSGGSFTVPTSGATISGIGAHYVEYHSGERYANTVWTSVNTGAALTWTSPQTFAANANTNALRWGTLYNFRFIATTPPAPGSVSLGMFKPGSPAQMVIAADVPGGGTIAGTPINDTCPGAVAMYGTQVGFSTAGATSSGPGACASLAPKTVSSSIDNDLWFTYINPCAGALVVDTCGSNFDTRLAVYSACPGTSGAAIACNDDDATCGVGSTQSRVSFAADSGATYYIRVGGFMGATGNGLLTVSPGCPVGACTNASNACQVITQSACATMGNTFGGDGSACPAPGRCCNNTTGVCTTALPANCTSGSTFTSTTTCATTNCPGTGACCNTTTGTCTMLLPAGCTSGSSYNGASSCTPNPCPVAQAPTNDACANAIPLYDNFPYTGSNANATTDYPGSSNLNCGTGNSSDKDVWFKYTPAISATSANPIRITTNTVVTGDSTNFDTVLSIHAACGTGATIIACSDDSGSPNLSSNISSTTLAAGVTYYIRVAGYTGGATATGTYTIRVIGGGATPPVPPANDNCAGRQGVGVGTPIAFDTTAGTTDGPIPTGCSMTQIDKDIWYNFPAQTTGILTISTCGSSFDTRIAVYQTSVCSGITDANLLACNDNFSCAGGGTTQSQLSVNVVLGTSYTIRIGGASGAGGVGSMFLSVVPTLGACCDATGGCHSLTLGDCTAASGNFMGVGQVCAPTPCAQPGACCNPLNGFCSSVLQTNCAPGNSFINGGVCTPNPCPQPGSCCNPADGFCDFILQSACLLPKTFAEGTCTPNPCAQPGACCDPAGGCSFFIASNCVLPNVYSAGVCAPNPCPQPGSCCNPADGFCDFILQADCNMPKVFSAGSCTPNPCPQPGACCDTTNGNCGFVLSSACALPSVFSAGSCSPNPCPQRGSCCNPADGHCDFFFQSACTVPNIFSAGSCSPNPCPQPPTGACCINTACSIATQANCTGSWQGPTFACGPTGNPTTCCPANVDQSGGVVVQDIFNFLSLWFASDMRADFDHSNVLNVADIFSYLAAWFAGC